MIPMHGGVEHAFDGHQVIVLPSQDEEDGDTIFTVSLCVARRDAQALVH